MSTSELKGILGEVLSTLGGLIKRLPFDLLVYFLVQACIPVLLGEIMHIKRGTMAVQ
jgi:hypothetical protein